MKNIRLLTLAFVLAAPLFVLGQQKELYTQYMFNGLTINPAYAGSHDALSLTGMSRWQWVGFEGAPNTQTISVHSPIKGKNVGLGLMVSRDEIGVSSRTFVSGVYSYRLQMGDGYLSMGLQGTMTNLKGEYSELFSTSNGTESTFGDISEFAPNFGAGLYYYTSKFYVGFSVPEFMNTKFESESATYTQSRHYFVNGGVVLNAGPNVKLKPNVLVELVDGAPATIDLNLNALINDFIWLGVSKRPNTISGIVQLNVNTRLSVGYAYDHVLQERLKEIGNASHEVMVNYRVPLFKDRVVTPRYF